MGTELLELSFLEMILGEGDGRMVNEEDGIVELGREAVVAEVKEGMEMGQELGVLGGGQW